METNNNFNKTEFSAIIIGKLMNIGGILTKEGNRLLAPYNLNQQQFSILFEIAKAGEIQQKDMINRLLLEKAHVSKVVKKLSAMGLLTITPLPCDKRSSTLSVTLEGQSIIDECRSVFKEWNNKWSYALSPDELPVLLESIDKLQQVFKSGFIK